MDAFTTWLRTQPKAPVVTPDDLYSYWEYYQALNFATFEAYTRGLDTMGRTPADTDPAQLLIAANAAVAGPALQPGGPTANTRQLAQSLNALSIRIDQLATVQLERERVELAVQAQGRRRVAPNNTNDEAIGGDEGTCTVRIQLQTNFTMKGGKDTLAAEALNDPAGVSEANIDAAFERIVLASGFNKKLTTKLREAYAIHKEMWHDYRVGTSTSVYFDQESITTSGRPSGGYRLDIENLRVAPGKQNFI